MTSEAHVCKRDLFSSDKNARRYSCPAPTLFGSWDSHQLEVGAYYHNEHTTTMNTPPQ